MIEEIVRTVFTCLDCNWKSEDLGEEKNARKESRLHEKAFGHSVLKKEEYGWCASVKKIKE